MLEKWVLKLFGSPMTSSEVQERIRYNCPSAITVAYFGNLESREIFF